tara:strand:+ start:188 stop:526 length:339 start_codon:yes stop_codon:yes gene_type:complete
MTDNKRVTNKQILDKINDLKVGEEGLNALAIKIVSRMMKIQTMTEWYEHVSSSDIAEQVMDKKLSMTEEENAIGNVARYMTLMNLFEDKEEYEKCAICKLKLDNINKILEKY